MGTTVEELPPTDWPVDMTFSQLLSDVGAQAVNKKNI